MATAKHNFHFVAPGLRSYAHKGQTYTPLIDVYRRNPDLHAPTEEHHIIDMWYNYGLGYVEELFPYTGEDGDLPTTEHLPALLLLLPPDLATFLTNVVSEYAVCPDISHGVVVVRAGMLYETDDDQHNKTASDIENLYLTPDGLIDLEMTKWQQGHEKYSIVQHHPTLTRSQTLVNSANYRNWYTNIEGNHAALAGT
jgi:hypothetical protein